MDAEKLMRVHERAGAIQRISSLSDHLRELNRPGTILLEANEILSVPQIKEWLRVLGAAEALLLRKQRDEWGE